MYRGPLAIHTQAVPEGFAVRDIGVGSAGSLADKVRTASTHYRDHTHTPTHQHVQQMCKRYTSCRELCPP